MMRNKLNFVNATGAVVVLLGMHLSALAGGNETRLEASLTATAEREALASGKAKFEMRSDRIRLSVEVQDVAVAGHVEVFVDGDSVGIVAVIAGGADINLDIRDGDSVPMLGAGALVQVRDTSDGTLILSGMLQPK